ncbi:MAG: glycosyl hydrolase, partial [Acidobacteriota bacterium]
HSPTRLFYASQRVWRSDDRGDSWSPVSPDLTRDQDRWHLPLMGRVWSYDSPWDVDAMSKFNTITSLAESPVAEGLLYAGTDDGLIQVSEDGGGSWRAVEVGSLPGVPDGGFVNDLKADLFDADTVYVALDDHKSGNFRPFLLKSINRGRSWSSIAGDLPDRHLVWRIVQDHIKPDLLFAGTEFGLFFTTDGGDHWNKLGGNVPTIPFRDLAIQRRENDLVGATFGRGFFILDDYSCLREATKDALTQEARLFSVRDAWSYIPRSPLGGRGVANQGAGHFIAPNPPFGAVFTYHLSEKLTSREEDRRKAEKELEKSGDDTPRPDWDLVEMERREEKPSVVLTVRNQAGKLVRRLEGPSGKGFHRVAWDLRYPSTVARAKSPETKADDDPRRNIGWLAQPGSYTVTLSKKHQNTIIDLGEPRSFEVRPLRKGVLEGSTPAEAEMFLNQVAQFERSVSAAGLAISKGFEHLDLIQGALARSTAEPRDFDIELGALKTRLYRLDQALRGNRSRSGTGEAIPHTILRRLEVIKTGNRFSTYGPTATHRRSLEIAQAEFAPLIEELHQLLEIDLAALETRMEDAGIPWTPGRPLPEGKQD